MTRHYLHLLRPTQWLKNLMLFFPPFLGGVLLHDGLALKGVIPVVSFCLASSAAYIFNDIQDASKDALHPRKKKRPIPAGMISKTAAAFLASFLFVVAILLGTSVSQGFITLLLLYLVVTVSYSLKLKNFPIVDLFCISAGFLIRLHAGGVVFGVAISEWLFLSVFLLSLFLSTGKRLCEKNAMGEYAGDHRKSLLLYPDGFLDGVMYLTGAAVLVTYAMYAVQRPALVYTVPLCTFGLLRYILRVKSGRGGDPTESLLKDGPLFIVGLLWAILVGYSIYAR